MYALANQDKNGMSPFLIENYIFKGSIFYMAMLDWRSVNITSPGPKKQNQVSDAKAIERSAVSSFPSLPESPIPYVRIGMKGPPKGRTYLRMCECGLEKKTAPTFGVWKTRDYI